MTAAEREKLRSLALDVIADDWTEAPTALARGVLDLLSPPPPHPTLQGEIDYLERIASGQSTMKDIVSGNFSDALRAVLAELRALRAVLADKIEESCAADKVRDDLRRTIAAWLVKGATEDWSAMESIAFMVMVKVPDLCAASGDLDYARIDKMGDKMGAVAGVSVDVAAAISPIETLVSPTSSLTRATREEITRRLLGGGE